MGNGNIFLAGTRCVQEANVEHSFCSLSAGLLSLVLRNAPLFVGMPACHVAFVVAHTGLVPTDVHLYFYCLKIMICRVAGCEAAMKPSSL